MYRSEIICLNSSQEVSTEPDNPSLHIMSERIR